MLLRVIAEDIGQCGHTFPSGDDGVTVLNDRFHHVNTLRLPETKDT